MESEGPCFLLLPWSTCPGGAWGACRPTAGTRSACSPSQSRSRRRSCPRSGVNNHAEYYQGGESQEARKMFSQLILELCRWERKKSGANLEQTEETLLHSFYKYRSISTDFTFYRDIKYSLISNQNEIRTVFFICCSLNMTLEGFHELIMLWHN